MSRARCREITSFRERAGFSPDVVELVQEVGEHAIGAEPADVQRRMLEAMGSVQVRSHDHLVVEAVDGVVEMHVVQTDLCACQRLQGPQMTESHVDSSWQGAVEILESVSLSGVLADGIRQGDTDPAAARAVLLNDPRKIDVLLWEEEERVAEDVQVTAGGCD